MTPAVGRDRWLNVGETHAPAESSSPFGPLRERSRPFDPCLVGPLIHLDHTRSFDRFVVVLHSRRRERARQVSLFVRVALVDGADHLAFAAIVDVDGLAGSVLSLFLPLGRILMQGDRAPQPCLADFCIRFGRRPSGCAGLGRTCRSGACLVGRSISRGRLLDELVVGSLTGFISSFTQIRSAEPTMAGSAGGCSGSASAATGAGLVVGAVSCAVSCFVTCSRAATAEFDTTLVLAVRACGSRRQRLFWLDEFRFKPLACGHGLGRSEQMDVPESHRRSMSKLPPPRPGAGLGRLALPATFASAVESGVRRLTGRRGQTHLPSSEPALTGKRAWS